MWEFTGCPFGGTSTISNSTPPTNAAEENAAISVNTRFSFTVDNEMKELAEGLQPRRYTCTESQHYWYSISELWRTTRLHNKHLPK